MKALQDVIIIRRLPQNAVTDSGIYLTPSGDFTEDIGEVVSAGPGKVSPKGIFIPNDIKEGDRVLFSTNGHQVTKWHGEELIVTRQNSIMAVING